MESKGLGKSALDKKPLGELYGNKDVNNLYNTNLIGHEKENKSKSKV